MSEQTKVRIEKNPVTPSEQAVAKAAAVVVETDAEGRALKLRKPGVLAIYRLIEALGPETAKNSIYVNMVLPIIYLEAIDGMDVFMPTKKSEVEAILQRLGDAGVAALLLGVEKHFGATDPEADRLAIKK